MPRTARHAFRPALRPTLKSAPAAALPAPVGHELRGLRARLAAYAPQAAHRLAELAGP
jgi:hypothetical protein